MRKTKEALAWIVAILRKNKIPFQISAGFAANLYGVVRPLADIDIDVPAKSLTLLYPHVCRYVVSGPRHYKDKNWDLDVLMMRYKGQEVDLCGADTARIYNKQKRKWVKYGFHLKQRTQKKAYGITVPLISKKDLIRYKSIIGRRVDRFDVKELKSLSKQR